jgi:hypothetical protein
MVCKRCNNTGLISEAGDPFDAGLPVGNDTLLCPECHGRPPDFFPAPTNLEDQANTVASNLKDLPEAWLQRLGEQIAAERVRRKEAAEAEALRQFEEWALKINSVEIVDIVAPTHGRTSCNDQNLNNGFDTLSEERTSPRCIRCALLEIVRDRGYHGSVVPSLLHRLGP